MLEEIIIGFGLPVLDKFFLGDVVHGGFFKKNIIITPDIVIDIKPGKDTVHQKDQNNKQAQNT
jgi:hypothetical protein